jgi:hypothetical protein
MKNVNEMSLDQKIMELQQCVSKARVGAENPGSVDYEFLQQAQLGDAREEMLAYYATLIQKANEYRSGKFNNLDYEVRQQGIRDINNKLDAALLAFPGYGLEEEIKMASGFGR